MILYLPISGMKDIAGAFVVSLTVNSFEDSSSVAIAGIVIWPK
jgi:hypothetical protein